MHHFSMQQNSVEWFKARSGMATASDFGNIITPKTMKPSSQITELAMRIAAERIMGKPAYESPTSKAMTWGHEYEQEAAEAYELQNGVTTHEGGFYTNDAFTYGASPDRRILDKGELMGLVEIKCPFNAANWMQSALEDEINPKYMPQVQGQILVSGALWVDYCSYHPDLGLTQIRVERDATWQDALSDALEQLEQTVRSYLLIMVEKGYAEQVPIKTIEQFTQAKEPDDMRDSILLAG